VRLGWGSPLAGLGAVIGMTATVVLALPALAQSDDFPNIENRPGASLPAGPVPRGETVDPVAPSEAATPSVEHTAPPAKPAQHTPAAPAHKKPTAAAGKTEVLPWANAPKEPLPTAASGPDSAAFAAATAQCAGLFEAACRDLKTCAWIAEVALPDGTTSPARCVARPPAPPKKSAKKPATPTQAAAKVKKTIAAPAAPAEKAAPAKESLPEKKSELAPAPDSPPGKTAATEPAAEEGSKPEKAPEPAGAEKKGPIVVTAPPAEQTEPPKKDASSAPAQEGPSFGAAFGGFGANNDEVVVTVPSH